MQKIMRFCHVTHSMKRIEIPLSHIRDKNKFKSSDFLFSFVQYFKTIFVTLLFNVLRLLFIYLVQCFKTFHFSYTQKNSLHFHSPFSLLLLYIHMSITFHTIPSQIRLDKKQCHLLSTFQ